MDPIIIQLRSVTIFWTDLGMPRYLSEHQKNVLAVWWDEEVEPWLDIAANDAFNPHEFGVWFAEPHDAVLFKLRFWNQYPNLQ